MPHVRISNAIQIAPVDLAAFLAGQRSGRHCTRILTHDRRVGQRRVVVLSLQLGQGNGIRNSLAQLGL